MDYPNEAREYGLKTWKHCTFIGILIIFVIVFTFVACDSGNGITNSGNEKNDFGDETTKFEGTWQTPNDREGRARFVFNKRSVIYTYDGENRNKGVFVFSDNYLYIILSQQVMSADWEFVTDQWFDMPVLVHLYFTYSNFKDKDSFVVDEADGIGAGNYIGIWKYE